MACVADAKDFCFNILRKWYLSEPIESALSNASQEGQTVKSSEKIGDVVKSTMLFVLRPMDYDNFICELKIRVVTVIKPSTKQEEIPSSVLKLLNSRVSYLAWTDKKKIDWDRLAYLTSCPWEMPLLKFQHPNDGKLVIKARVYEKGIVNVLQEGCPLYNLDLAVLYLREKFSGTKGVIDVDQFDVELEDQPDDTIIIKMPDVILEEKVVSYIIQVTPLEENTQMSFEGDGLLWDSENCRVDPTLVRGVKTNSLTSMIEDFDYSRRRVLFHFRIKNKSKDMIFSIKAMGYVLDFKYYQAAIL